MKLFIKIVFVSSCSCTKHNGDITVEDAMKWLTNGSSKTWVLFEHNFLEPDNSSFTDQPPYVFLNIYIIKQMYLVLRNDHSFSIGDNENKGKGFWGKWKLDNKSMLILSDAGSMEDLNEIRFTSSYQFNISKLNNNNLFIRMGANKNKPLPYYEFRFRQE